MCGRLTHSIKFDIVLQCKMCNVHGRHYLLITLFPADKIVIHGKINYTFIWVSTGRWPLSRLRGYSGEAGALSIGRGRRRWFHRKLHKNDAN